MRTRTGPQRLGHTVRECLEGVKTGRIPVDIAFERINTELVRLVPRDPDQPVLSPSSERGRRSREVEFCEELAEDQRDPIAGFIARLAETELLDRAGLEERERRCVLMLYHGGYTEAEVGQLLGCTDRTVRNLKTRAFRKLRALGPVE